MPARGRGDRVHHLHRLDDQQRVARLDLVADRDERRRARLGREIDGADHRRLDRARMVGRARRCGRRRRARRGGGAAAAAGAGAGAAAATPSLRLTHDAAVAVLDLDLGEVGLVEQLGELAHQLGVDLHRLVAWSSSAHRNSFSLLSGARTVRDGRPRPAQARSRARRTRRSFPWPPCRHSERWRKPSRACGLERWTSITGT